MPDRGFMLIAIIVGVSLTTSFLCSLLEACLYSVSRSRIETLRRAGDPRSRTLVRLRAQIDESIAAILIVNTSANTLGAAWAGAKVAEYYGNRWLGLFSALFTAAVLFFAEIVPKSLGVRFSAVLAPILARPLQLMVWALWPVIKLCVLMTRVWGKGAHLSRSSEEDIISLAHLVHKDGEIYEQEAQWVANALRLNDVTAYDLMTPSPVVARVPKTMALRDTQVNTDHWRFSRLPVTADDDPDEIVGVVRRRKVFDALARDEFDRTMEDMMDPPDFVPAGLPAHRLLDRFLQKRRHLFCVLNEQDAFSGVVTLEDVLECLLGREIVDETDLHEDMQAVARRRKDALLARRGGTSSAPRTSSASSGGAEQGGAAADQNSRGKRSP
ncbi:MAG TPA: hemolysin family protein [Sumerlaeia bacterium]|nr:hemolysin family protein [Sumerlaeia bacterium]